MNHDLFILLTASNYFYSFFAALSIKGGTVILLYYFVLYRNINILCTI